MGTCGGGRAPCGRWGLRSYKSTDACLDILLAVGSAGLGCETNTLASLSSQAPAVQVCPLGKGGQPLVQALLVAELVRVQGLAAPGDTCG